MILDATRLQYALFKFTICKMDIENINWKQIDKIYI